MDINSLLVRLPVFKREDRREERRREKEINIFDLCLTCGEESGRKLEAEG